MARPRPPSSRDEDPHLTSEERTAIQELLRHGIPEPEEESTSILGPDVRGGGGERIVLRYDLAGGSGRRDDDLPGLQLVHDRYAAELSTEFRRAVGDEGNFFSERISYAKFAEIYARFGASVFLVANLTGVGCSVIIAMEPMLALHFIDLLMGGEGGLVSLRGDPGARPLTEAEKGLCRHLLAILGRALKTSWAEVADVDLELQRVATDPRHVAIFEPNENITELSLRVEWGQVDGSLRMFMPTSFFSQFDAVLSRTTTTPSAPRGSASNNDAAMRASLMSVTVGISAIFGRTELTLERFLSLGTGDVLRLDADPTAPLVLCVEDMPKMTGTPTVRHGNIAVTVADFIHDDTLGYEQGAADADPPSR